MIRNLGHILVVDDDRLNRMTLARGLERQGHTVALAENGSQALEMVQEQSFDLMLLDIVMPEMDGYQVLEHIRDNGTVRHIPVIVISSVDEMDSAAKCIRMGAEDYLTKPFNPVLLKARIGASLEKKHLRDQEQAYLKQLQIERERLVLLNRMSQELTAVLDLPQVIEQLLQAVTEIVGAEGALVWLQDKNRDKEGRWLVCRAAFHRNQRRPLLNVHLPFGQGIAGWVAETGKSALVSHAPDDPRFSFDLDRQMDFHTKSLLAVPLPVRQTVIGVLEVVNKVNGDFDVGDRTLVETLAASAAIALDNAELFESLRQHMAELETRNEELDAFAHTVAHDLKNPLGAVMGLSDGLVGTFTNLSDDKLQNYLQTIAQTSRNMNNIIHELLLLANVRQVEEVEVKPVDMASIVAEAQGRLADLITQRQAEIILPPTWPIVSSYGPWIEEVWVNYISNAIKYGGRPPHIELGADSLRGVGGTKGAMVRFWVHDNGPGLTPEEQARLFTPFTRLDQVRAKGHGLGLSIVRRIVEKLTGQVGVNSQIGQGSIFSFTLPISALD